VGSMKDLLILNNFLLYIGKIRIFFQDQGAD
jgi:hypothetical protein